MPWGTGFRVYLGTTESVEKRDFPITAGTGDDQEVIGVEAKKRQVIVERAEYRGMSRTAAMAQAPTAGWTVTARERVDDSGQWRVTEEVRANGLWVADT